MMSKPLLFALLLTGGAAFAGCAGGEADVRYGGSVAVVSPDLVTIDNGLQVIADADQPVFYTDDAYWLYRDGGWYKSSDYRNGWAHISIEIVPMRLRRIDRPEAYVHYRQSNERTRTVTRENRSPQAPQRDIRTPDRDPQPAPAPYANPLPPQQQPPVPDQNVAPDVHQRADRERADREKAEREAKKRADDREKDRANRTRDRGDDDKRDRDDADREDHPDRDH